MWEMAAGSLHNDIFLDSSKRTKMCETRDLGIKRHERASYCAEARDDSLVGSLAGAREMRKKQQKHKAYTGNVKDQRGCEKTPNTSWEDVAIRIWEGTTSWEELTEMERP